MFLSLCVSKVSKNHWKWMQWVVNEMFSEDDSKTLCRMSGNSLQLPQTPRPGPWDAAQLFVSCFHWELEYVLWNWDRWQSWLNRQMIWDFWCKNHLPFRIPPLLSSTLDSTSPPPIPISVPSVSSTHSYDIQTYLFSLETRLKSPDYLCWCDPSFIYLLTALGLRCSVRVFSSFCEQGLSSLWCMGFSLQWLLFCGSGCRWSGFSSCSTQAQ